jgi:hypothetical protein
MDDEKKLVLELDDDALAQSMELDDPFALYGRERRVDRAEKKGASNGDLIERLTENAGAELGEVERDVGKLGH